MTELSDQVDPGPQPDPMFVIKAMNDELVRVNNNRMWALSMLEQRTAEVQQLSSTLSELQGEVLRLRAAANGEAALESGFGDG